MATSDHLDTLSKGVEHWNQWRAEHPQIRPNLVGADLRHGKLRGINLAKAELADCALIGTDLSHADLRSSNLDNADLTGADLSETDLTGASLQGAYLMGANLTQARLNGADLKDANLIGADVTSADLTGVQARSVRLNYANLEGAILDEADFTHSESEESGDIRTYYPEGAPKGAVPPPAGLQQDHLNVLFRGVEEWNRWRDDNPEIEPDLMEARLPGLRLPEGNLSLVLLAGADLSKADLSGCDMRDIVLEGANLTHANLRGANLSGAAMSDANLLGADLSGAIMKGTWLSAADLAYADFTNADLTDAVLESARMVRTKVGGARLVGCRIHGVSAWDLEGKPAEQSDLDISRWDQPTITVDDIKVAQFIYLLLNNKNIRDIIDTIGAKGVLILGRFGSERKPVLDALRSELRKRDYLPMVFDFEKPTQRDFTETVMTLAGMSLFVIADITNPRSVPLELQATVPNYMIPFVPIIQEGEPPFAMFQDLDAKFNWVLDVLEYDTITNLIAGMDKAIIMPALRKHEELLQARARKLGKRNIKRYLPSGDEL